MKKRIITLLAVLALLVTCAVFAVQADDKQDPAAPAVALTGDETCPVCSLKLSEITDWVEATSATTDWTAEHIIIKENLTLNASPAWGANAQTILIRSSADFSETATPVTVSMNANKQFTDESVWLKAKLSIFGESATIESKMYGSNGGMFRINNSAGALVVQGSVTLKPAEGASAGTSGGIIFVNGGAATFKGVTFQDVRGTTGSIGYVHNGNITFENCTFNDCSATSSGILHLVSGADATTLTNCVINRSSATNNGGAMNIQGGTVTLTNTQFNDCTANNGGALYVSGSPTVTMNTCTIDGCVATAKATDKKDAGAGGGIYLSGGTVNMTSCTIQNCVASAGETGTVNNGHGGGIYQKAGKFNNTDASTVNTIQNCAAVRGGGVYLTDADQKTTGATPVAITVQYNMKGGEIKGCTASNNGAQVFMTGNANTWFNMSGASVITANSNSGGGSKGVRVQGGNFRMTGGTVKSLGNQVGSGIYAINASTDGTCNVWLRSSSKVEGPNGEMNGNIRLEKYDGKYPELRIVTSDWKGKASFACYTGSSASTEVIIDMSSLTPVADFVKTYKVNAAGTNFEAHTDTVSLGGELFSECDEVGRPQFYAYGGTAMPYRTQVIAADGSTVCWVLNNNASAIKSANDANGYLKLWTDRQFTDIDASFTVDLNGNTPKSMAFTNEDAVVTVFDSKAAAGEKGATIPTTKVVTGLVEFGDREYYVKAGAENAAVYPIEYKITQVALRPYETEASMYYVASVKAHDDVDVTAWGVAVTLNPEETVLTNHLYTVATTMGEINSVLVKGIVSNDGEENQERAKAEIYAKAYVTIDGVTHFSDAADYSLIKLINKINAGGKHEGAMATVGTYTWYTGLDLTV